MRPRLHAAFLSPEANMMTGGAPADYASGPPQYGMPVAFRLLREAAEAAAAVWAGPLYPQSRDRAQRQLGRALGDLCAVVAKLAAADRRPQLIEFSRSLDQARRDAEAMPVADAGEPDGSRGEHGDVLRAAARHVIGVWKQQEPRPRTPDADIAELLGAVQALADAAKELARGAGEPAASQLGGVRDGLTAATGHLRAVLPPGPAPGAEIRRRSQRPARCPTSRDT